jgi:spore germination cell wall hydrolase CwlJ-like protein
VRLFHYIVLFALLTGCVATPTPRSAPGESVRAEQKHAQPRGAAEGSANQQPVAVRKRVDPEGQKCMALAMYWEARGEGEQGMLAVGSVILNRVEDSRFPDNVCAVVYQGGETPPCQFSWWCDGKSHRPTNANLWSVSMTLAEELLAARPPDPTQGALFFHSNSIRSPWRRQRTAQIGNHIFYR